MANEQQPETGPVAEPAAGPALHEGLVTKTRQGAVYEVALPDGVGGEETVLCRVRGRLKAASRSHTEHVTVGDRVMVERIPRDEDTDLGGLIEAVRPRTTELTRGRPGKPPQTIVANIDRLFVVVAVAEPMLSLHALDRFLAIAAVAGIEPWVVLNKIDHDPDGEIAAIVRDIYEPIGVRVVATSTVTRDGLEALDDALAGWVSAVVGPSGAGKSSLLNALNPGYQLRTGEVMAIGKGRHTTTTTALLPLDRGGYVADTPGIKTIQLLDNRPGADPLDRAFPEVAEHAEACQFSDCTHRTEPGCAVVEAVEAGEIADTRYDSYVRLYEELTGERVW